MGGALVASCLYRVRALPSNFVDTGRHVICVGTGRKL